jgi:hypothetical protein
MPWPIWTKPVILDVQMRRTLVLIDLYYLEPRQTTSSSEHSSLCQACLCTLFGGHTDATDVHLPFSPRSFTDS